MGRRLVERGHQVTIVCGSYRASDTGLRGPFVRGQRRGTVDSLEVVEIDLPYSNEEFLPQALPHLFAICVTEYSPGTDREP